MEKKIYSDISLTTSKSVYEKPTSTVYEMEIEGAILAGSGGTDGKPSDMEYGNEWNS